MGYNSRREYPVENGAENFANLGAVPAEYRRAIPETKIKTITHMNAIPTVSRLLKTPSFVTPAAGLFVAMLSCAAFAADEGMAKPAPAAVLPGTTADPHIAVFGHAFVRGKGGAGKHGYEQTRSGSDKRRCFQ